MLAQFARCFAVAAFFQQFEYMQVLQALLADVVTVFDRAVGEQAPYTVQTTNGVNEEGVARGFNQGFMEFDPAFVQLVGAVGFDAALQEQHFGFAAAGEYGGVKPVAWFEQRGGFDDEA